MSPAKKTYDKILTENLDILDRKPHDVCSLYNCGTLLVNCRQDYVDAARMFDRVLEVDEKVREVFFTTYPLLGPMHIMY